MEMGQMVLNKDSNEVRRFLETMENISKSEDFLKLWKIYPKYWIQILLSIDLYWMGIAI